MRSTDSVRSRVVCRCDCDKASCLIGQSAPTGTYSGFADCGRKMIAEGGAGTLFKGFGPAMLRAFPAVRWRARIANLTRSERCESVSISQSFC